MRAVTKIIFLLLISFSLPAQIEFSKIPKYLQFFPRDTANYGHFEIQGYSPSPGVLRTVLSEMLSGTPAETFTRTLKAYESFTVAHNIPACLKEYKLEVFLKEDSQPEQLEKLVYGLLAGDFFMVDGQSNAECAPSDPADKHDSIFYNPFTRVIGLDFSVATGLSADSAYPAHPVEEDLQFKRPSSTYYYHEDFGFSGVWPMNLQCDLANKSGVPNCFINGSQGGTEINKHFASHTPSKPDSLLHSNGPHYKPRALIYDRMFKKLYANNAIAGVKGIFWYQGESDGNMPLDSSLAYGQKFKRLYTSWKADYPSLKKIFVVQINMGCGGENHNVIREFQRTFPEHYPDVVAMSTVGSPITDRAPDLCHYTVEGYTRVGKKLLPLAEKYIYDLPLQEELILPANIKKAYYTNQLQICLEFDKAVIIQDSSVYPLPDKGTAYIKDYFFREAGSSIGLVSVTSEANKVFLNLAPKQLDVNKITYLPKIFTNIPSLYSGPWILNENNPELGAYSFFEFPVERLPEKNNFSFFPNPAKDHIEFRFKESGTNKIWIYDLYGKLILSANTKPKTDVLNLTAFDPGVYILLIQLASGTITTSKLFVE
jgi:hypothetical protein